MKNQNKFHFNFFNEKEILIIFFNRFSTERMSYRYGHYYDDDDDDDDGYIEDSFGDGISVETLLRLLSGFY